jgi:hypothetical protein
VEESCRIRVGIICNTSKMYPFWLNGSPPC